MSNNNFFMVAFKLLSYLRYCYENSITPSAEMLRPSTYNIEPKQFGDTLEMLINEGYISGLHFISTKDGKLLTAVESAHITIAGLQYLEENSMMKKAYKVAKEIKEWLPFI